MRTLKKRLALLLSALMLVSVLPTAAWAGETAVGTAVGGDLSSGVQASEEMLPTYLSLLPLDEDYLDLDLTHYLPGELAAVPVQTILDNTTNYSGASPITVGAGETIVWAANGDDNFQFVKADDVIDLTPQSDYTNRVYLTLIVGDGDQLNPDNKRYEIHVNITPIRDLDLFTFQVKSEEGVNIEIYNSYLSHYNSIAGDILRLYVNNKKWKAGEWAYLTMGLNTEFVGLSAEVYKGRYDSEAEAIAAGAENITEQIWGAAEGYLADYSYQSGYRDMPEVTVVLKRDGKIAYTTSFIVNMQAAYVDFNLIGLYKEEGDQFSEISYSHSYYYHSNKNYQRITVELDPNYETNDLYYVALEFDDPADDYIEDNGIAHVQSACVGRISEAADMPSTGDETDITNLLFTHVDDGGGYQDDFSGGVIFSILDTNGDIYYCEVIVEEYEENIPPEKPEPELPPAPTPGSEDTYFRVEDAKGNGYQSYMMSYEDDSYYYNGYQTIFLLQTNDGTNSDFPKDVYTYMPVADDEIIPLFYTGGQVNVYAGEGTTSGTRQVSGVTSIPFTSRTPIQYSAAAESGNHLKNYWVTFLTLQPGPKLFVNATNYEGHYDEEDNLPVRTIYLDEAHNYRHDIFMANIGTQELTGLTVTLSEDAQNIALDEYWQVRDGSTQTLGAFDSASSADMGNIAKVRLVAPEGAQGEISGTLTISADGQEDVVIKLTGVAGVPKITTTDIRDGVKYVPYSSVIQTNNMDASDAIRFTLVSGELPRGVELKPNGEIYGAPTEYGEFTFTVKAAYNGEEEYSDTAEFTMTVLNNTNENVEGATDPGYELDVRVPDRLTEFTDQVFESRGELGEFQDFWLDGRKLEKDVDYTAEEGSTKITIKAQTFQSAGSGTHTIAAEFRVNGNVNGELKRAAQNYTAPGGGGGGSSTSYYTPSVSKSENGSVTLSTERAKKGDVVTVTVKPDTGYELDKLTVRDNKGNVLELTKKSENVYTFVMPSGTVDVKATFKAVEPEIIPAQGQPFLDVAEGAWYVDAVKYAYENGLMAGVSATQFAPEVTTSRGMVVTILYSLEGKPQVSGCSFTDVASDAYYADATCWAAQNGIVSGYGDGIYGPNDPVTREQLAIIMMNYAKQKGLDVSKRGDLSAFTDVSIASAGAQDALSWANAMGLLAGKGDGILDPVGQATRAEASAILGQFHRLMEEMNQENVPQDVNG